MKQYYLTNSKMAGLRVSECLFGEKSFSAGNFNRYQKETEKNYF